jgi:ribosomal protein S18 acetylase RimI-like enzyme
MIPISPKPSAPKSKPARLKYSIPAAGPTPFVQQVTLIQDGQPIATARWHATDSEEGVFQILDLAVHPDHHRQGHGSTLIRAVYDEAAKLFKSMGQRPRRVWITIEQKRHVIARAFLSRHGYHHVSTIKNLYSKQDAMIYQKSFD